MSNETHGGKRSEAALVQSRLDEVIQDLRQEHTNEEIACLALVVVRGDGNSRRFICGDADPFLLMGSFEYLKGVVLQHQLNAEENSEESPSLN